MTPTHAILKKLPVALTLLAALAGCGGGSTVGPGVQTAQANTSSTSSNAPSLDVAPGTVAPVPELAADPADVAAANAAAAAAAATPLAMPATPTGVVDPAANAAANAVTPAPDCAAEGCSRLRVIDGNAEAYRADAQVRDNRDQAALN